METLLDVAKARYGLAIDPDSDGGKILGSLTPSPELAPGAAAGKASVGALSLGLTDGGGVSMRPATTGDAFTMEAPKGPWDFAIVTRPDGTVAVEVELVGPRIKLPGCRPAREAGENSLAEIVGGGDVRLVPPKLLLIVEARPGEPVAHVRIGPSRDAAGALEATIEPGCFLVGPGTVLGFLLPRVTLDLDNPGGARVSASQFDVFVAPPGIAALAMRGGAQGLVIELGTPGGLSGDFALQAAGETANRPRFLRELKAHLRLNRNSVVLLELTGQIALDAEITAVLGNEIGDGPRSLAYRLALTLGDGRAPGDDWKTSLELHGEGGAGFLWRSKRGEPHVASLARDTLGAYAVFAPLLAPLVPGAGTSGYVDLGLDAGLAVGLAAARVITAQQVTIYGAELSAGSTGTATAANLFFDVETDLNIDVPTLLKSKHAIRVRQKAVGLRLDVDGGELRPVFDPGKGFSLDLSDPGTFEIAEPLGSFLQPDKPRIARENPLVLEFTLTPKAKLGVLTIDKATVRVPLEGDHGPSITALGARVTLPAMSGGGYLKIEPDGFAGGFDLALGAPLSLRVAADLSIRRQPGFASARMGIDVRWPIPIPLANSGLGLFGLLGMFVLNEERQLGPSQNSLEWYNACPGHNPARGVWIGRDEAWALGLGAVVGTLEGGYLINAKGLLLLELPGPRLALFMEARLLKNKPEVAGDERGNLLAVIEIGDESLLVGIVARYEVPFLIALEVPAEALFHFKHREDWHIDIGQVDGVRASVRFMQVIKADGYLMLHGDGIPALGLDGFAVAAGIEAALTWGPAPIGLYIRVAARADVALSFKPPMVRGHLALEGELHLFIVSIGVSAAAELIITDDEFHVFARVSGHVDFFFFRVEGSVTLELGKNGLKPQSPEPLLRCLTLHARSSALLPGSGVAGPIDGSLGQAAMNDSGTGWSGTKPVVAIDAIPVLQFEMTPRVNGTKFAGRPIVERLMPDGWTRRGRRFYRYTLKSVTIEAIKTATGKPLQGPLVGPSAPNTWWDQRPASPKGMIGDDGGAQLALLSWIPQATPAAARRTVERDEGIERRWGTACDPVADATAVLWTFAGRNAGPSASGWALRGLAWPDNAGTTRTRPASLSLKVSEPWRRGTPLSDAMFAVTPAYLTGSQGNPQRILVAPKTGPKLLPRVDEQIFAAWCAAAKVNTGLDTMPDAIRIGGDGLRHVRGLLFAVRETGPLTLRGCAPGDGNNGFEASIDKRINGLGDVPGQWRKEPWEAPVTAAFKAWVASPSGPEHGGQLYLFDFELPEDTAAVEIGMLEDRSSGLFRWGLIVFEAITDAEFRRRDFDSTHRQDMINVIDGALGVDDSPRALLQPGATYTIRVDYSALATDADADGNPVVDPAAQPEDRHQSFAFRTDTAAPARLEPYVVATNPEEGAEAVFYEDLIRIVFTNATVRRMYKQYGVDLFAKVYAASGNHPPSPTGLRAGEALLADTGTPSIGIAAQAYTPFESALRDAMQGSCVPVDHRDGDKHDVVSIPMKLEPMTGYVLDIEGRNKAKAVTVGSARDPALRRTFTTSRYGSAAGFAAAIKAQEVGDRHIAEPAWLTGLAAGGAGLEATVSDLAFDEALQKVGWGHFDRLVKPRVTVLWRGATGEVPQPFAIYLETPEAVWRSRGTPEQVMDAAGAKDWELTPQPWLKLTTTSPAVTRLVHTTSGMRTLVLLGNGSRGQVVTVDLCRLHHALFEANEPAPAPEQALYVTLNSAPWEIG